MILLNTASVEFNKKKKFNIETTDGRHSSARSSLLNSSPTTATTATNVVVEERNRPCCDGALIPIRQHARLLSSRDAGVVFTFSASAPVHRRFHDLPRRLQPRPFVQMFWDLYQIFQLYGRSRFPIGYPMDALGRL